MSKMGRYVFNSQETADADSDRQAHSVPKRTKIPDLPLDMMETGDSFVAPIDASNPVEVRR